MHYIRNPQVRATDVDGEFFLVEPGSGEIFYLDTVASGLWRLLAEPQDEATLVETYRAAFPDEAPERIGADVAAALQTLLEGRLVSADASLLATTPPGPATTPPGR